MTSRDIGMVNVGRKLLLDSKIKKVDPFTLVLGISHLRDLCNSGLNYNTGKDT